MSTDFVQNLIECVRVRPFLYSKSHLDHTNVSKKTNAWREIQTEMGEEVLYLKAKWKNLKDTYRKHKLSMQATEAGSGRLSNWVWADRMQFLDCEDPLNFPNDNVDEEEIEDSASESEIVKKPNNVTKVDVPFTNSNRISRKRNSGRMKFITSKQIQNRRDSDRTVQFQNGRKRTDEVLDNSSKNDSNGDKVNVRNDKINVPCDGDDLMFLGYSNSFKKLSHRKQISVKYEFAKILMKAELEDEECVQKYDTVEISDA